MDHTDRACGSCILFSWIITASLDLCLHDADHLAYDFAQHKHAWQCALRL